MAGLVPACRNRRNRGYPGQAWTSPGMTSVSFRRPTFIDYPRGACSPSDMVCGDSIPSPTFRLEARLMRLHGGPVVGLDEAGRGPWAGPVVAAAVIIDQKRVPAGLTDSKLLTAEEREALFEKLRRRAHKGQARIGVGVGHVTRIDRDNILQASLWAMCAAYQALGISAAAAIVDGNIRPRALPCPCTPLVGGDSKSVSVAAASIIAKVVRDRLMTRLALRVPGYGWERNKGYGTPEHAAAIAALGVNRYHRRSFSPISQALLMAEAISTAA